MKIGVQGLTATMQNGDLSEYRTHVYPETISISQLTFHAFSVAPNYLLDISLQINKVSFTEKFKIAHKNIHTF